MRRPRRFRHSRPGRVRRHVRSWRKPTPHSEAHPLARVKRRLKKLIGRAMRRAIRFVEHLTGTVFRHVSGGRRVEANGP